MSKLVISVQNLSKAYKPGNQKSRLYDILRDFKIWSARSEKSLFWALKNVSFNVEQGDVVGVIGANGAGKSTLLKLMSEVTSPTSGKILLRGRVTSLLEVGTGFHPELSVIDNMYLNGALLGMRRSEIHEKRLQILEFAELEAFEHYPVKHLSSGMRVRLAFSIAIHLVAEIILMDEVFAVGDLSFRLKCLQAIESMLDSRRTVMITSHDFRELRSVCTKCLFLDQGELIAYGDTESVIQEYLKYHDKRINALSGISLKRSTNDDIQITSFSIKDSHDTILEHAITGAPLSFHITYNVKAPLQDVVTKLFIKSPYGEILAHFNTRFKMERIINLEGTGSIQCIIPKLPLRPGKYILELEMMSLGTTVYKNSTIGVLEVASGNYYGFETMADHRGKFFIDQEWRL